MYQLPDINKFRTLPEGFINWGEYANALIDEVTRLSQENNRLRHFILEHSHIECSEVNHNCNTMECLKCKYFDYSSNQLLDMVIKGEYDG